MIVEALVVYKTPKIMKKGAFREQSEVMFWKKYLRDAEFHVNTAIERTKRFLDWLKESLCVNLANQR